MIPAASPPASADLPEVVVHGGWCEESLSALAGIVLDRLSAADHTHDDNGRGRDQGGQSR